MIANDFLNIAEEEEKRDYKFNRWYNQSLVDKDKGKIVNIPDKRKRSFSLIAGYCRFPCTERYVTIPVTPSVAIPTPPSRTAASSTCRRSKIALRTTMLPGERFRTAPIPPARIPKPGSRGLNCALSGDRACAPAARLRL